MATAPDITVFHSILESTVADHSDPECIGLQIVVLTQREAAARAHFHMNEGLHRAMPSAMNRALAEHARFEWLAAKHDLEEAIDRFWNPGAF